MDHIIEAVFQNGAFKPLNPVDLKEGQHVRLVIEAAPPNDILALAAQVYDGLTEDEINAIEKIAIERRDFFE